MKSYHDDSGWWGGRGRSANRLTLLDMVRNNTLDARLAALLWLLVEKKSSIIVAAAPQKAGKTTLLTAILDFAPPWYEKVYTKGQDEDFSFLPQTDPLNTYILAPELSDHTPYYLWGDAVKALFEAMGKGYSMAATMHADTPQDVIWMLDGYPLYIPHAQLANIHVIVNLRLLYGERDFLRRVSLVTLVASDLTFMPLAGWDAASDTFALARSAETLAELSARLGLSAAGLDAEIARRAETIGSWLSGGPVSPDELQRRVAAHYASLAPDP